MASRPRPSRPHAWGMIRFLRLIAAVSSGDPCFHARALHLGSASVPIHIPGGAARLSRWRGQPWHEARGFVGLVTSPIAASPWGLSVIPASTFGAHPSSSPLHSRVHGPQSGQATLLGNKGLLTRPIPASACGHDQVSEVDGSAQVPVMLGPQFGQFHVRSRFSFAFTLPQALQVRLLGNHMGRVTWVCRHWPLASSSRAALHIRASWRGPWISPGSAHPRQERGGARLSQHGVTAPGDDAGHVDLEGKHQVGDQDSFRQRRVAGPVSPSLHGVARAGPSRSIGPLPGGNSSRN